MAIKKIQMIPEGANNYGDILHPETSLDMIVGQGMFGTATGTNTYAVSIPNFPSLVVGYKVTVKFPTANTGNSTLNVNGLGAKSITKAEGVHIPPGTIKANGIYTLVYGGAYFHLQGEGGVYGTARASDVASGKTIGTDNGLVSGTLALSGNAPVANVLAGNTFYNSSLTAKLTGTMANRGTLNSTITTNNGQVSLATGYYVGGIIKATFANLIASNIKSGINIGGIVGTYTGASIIKNNTIKLANGTISIGVGSRKDIYTIAPIHRNCLVTVVVSRKSTSGTNEYTLTRSFYGTTIVSSKLNSSGTSGSSEYNHITGVVTLLGQSGGVDTYTYTVTIIE